MAKLTGNQKYIYNRVTGIELLTDPVKHDFDAAEPMATRALKLAMAFSLIASGQGKDMPATAQMLTDTIDIAAGWRQGMREDNPTSRIWLAINWRANEDFLATLNTWRAEVIMLQSAPSVPAMPEAQEMVEPLLSVHRILSAVRPQWQIEREQNHEAWARSTHG